GDGVVTTGAGAGGEGAGRGGYGAGGRRSDGCRGRSPRRLGRRFLRRRYRDLWQCFGYLAQGWSWRGQQRQSASYAARGHRCCFVAALLRLRNAVNFPTRQPPSPYVRARNTSLDCTANGSAGVHSTLNMNGGINGAADWADSALGIMRMAAT